VENVNSLRAQQQPAHSERSFAEKRQSYLLLAVGILIAVAVPYLVRPRGAIPSATPTTTVASARLSPDH
jgi:hypothetical protein